MVAETDETCNNVRNAIDTANQAIADDLGTLNTLMEDTDRITNESQLYLLVNFIFILAVYMSNAC